MINLLESGGLADYIATAHDDEWTKRQFRWAPGVVGSHPPFSTREEERLAEARIDLFMSDVLIPLAASTNAVVICCALQGWCALSESFTRMYSLVRARYPGRPPFTVISATQVCVAYHHLFRPLLSSCRVLLLPSL